MLPSLELIVSPTTSRIYRRLLVIVYFLSVLFIVNTSFYLALKLVLTLALLVHFRFYYRLGKPHPELCEIKYQGGEWVISSRDEKDALFNTLIVLIHNPLFQLLQVSHMNKNKLLILFNDQLSKQQLRLLHLKSVKN